MRHTFRFLFTSLCITMLCMTSFAQNTSPVNVIEFNKIPNGIMDEGKLDRNQLEDYDNNPVCLVKIKAQGFDESTLQKLIFVPKNIMIMHKAYDNGEYRLYVSSKKPGSIVIKYQGDCEFKLPYNLEPKKIYELVLGMETATLMIRATPEESVIYIDDEKVGTGNVSQAVSIGAEHRYRVECENYFEKEDVVTLQKGERKSLNIELEPAFGFITVKTTPSGADVYIDDKLVGKTPYLSEIISRGMHKITVNKEGYETAVKRLNINVNEESNVEFELVEGESSMPVQLVVTAEPANNNKNSGNIVETDADGNKIFTVNGVTFKMIKVEGGKFMMGATEEQVKYADNNEKPVHNVTLSNYYIGEFEVTQGLWKAVMGVEHTFLDSKISLATNKYVYFEVGWDSKIGKDRNMPAYYVSWEDCEEFIRELNDITNMEFRLPTEAEWEYAARGGKNSKGFVYSGGDDVDNVAWFKDNCSKNIHNVGQKTPNELGIYDMSGNVWEWCCDKYAKYKIDELVNPTVKKGGEYVLRGGGWSHSGCYCRVSSRNSDDGDERKDHRGFRLVLVQ